MVTGGEWAEKWKRERRQGDITITKKKTKKK